MVSSSSRVNTLPVGLFGVLMMIARVLLLKRGRELVGIEQCQSRLVQRHVARRGAGENRVGPVVLVERLEDDDFVARIDDRHHRRHHRFGRAAADRHLLVGDDLDAVAAR